MKNKKFLVPVIFVITMVLLPGTLLCQSKTENNDYEPELGQEGKDVIWYPTPQILVDKMLDMAQLTPADFLIDLGSGDGRIVITAAKRGTRAAGIEYNPNMVEYARRNAKKEGVADKTDFINADIFEYDFSKATVVTMFLLPELNIRLRPKILEMKPGTRIITNTFSMQDWHYDEMKEIDDESISWNTAYLWIVPAKVEGTWKCNEGELSLSQEFQEVSGEINKNGKAFKVSSGKLRGDEFRFICNGVNYKCQVNKNSMKGMSEKNGKVSSWEAVKKM
ncbi:MAG TPA: methyltransferase domain-containing protein [Draconibacterium sp.]|nr:methyltransferase domain-containing protein [Draconibacterium sp.]